MMKKRGNKKVESISIFNRIYDDDHMDRQGVEKGRRNK